MSLKNLKDNVLKKQNGNSLSKSQTTIKDIQKYQEHRSITDSRVPKVFWVLINSIMSLKQCHLDVTS